MQRSLKSLDLRVRHHLELVPALPENRDESVRLADLDVARLVHGVAHEEVAGKQRRLRQLSARAAARPDIDRWKKDLQALAGHLITHMLLAIAPSPEDVPLWAGSRVRCGNRLGLWQGFAPFGSARLAAKPIRTAPRVSQPSRASTRWWMRSLPVGLYGQQRRRCLLREHLAMVELSGCPYSICLFPNPWISHSLATTGP